MEMTQRSTCGICSESNELRMSSQSNSGYVSPLEPFTATQSQQAGGNPYPRRGMLLFSRRGKPQLSVRALVASGRSRLLTEENTPQPKNKYISQLEGGKTRATTLSIQGALKESLPSAMLDLTARQ